VVITVGEFKRNKEGTDLISSWKQFNVRRKEKKDRL